MYSIQEEVIKIRTIKSVHEADPDPDPEFEEIDFEEFTLEQPQIINYVELGMDSDLESDDEASKEMTHSDIGSETEEKMDSTTEKSDSTIHGKSDMEEGEESLQEMNLESFIVLEYPETPLDNELMAQVVNPVDFREKNNKYAVYYHSI